MYCQSCGIELHKGQSKYCSNSCQQQKAYEDYLIKWKNNEVTGLRGTTVSLYIKRYLRIKYNGKCAKCGWGEIHPRLGYAPLEVEHIDGDYKNNKEENLLLLCPNCHALSDTYKALNIGNGRPNRKKIK